MAGSSGFSLEYAIAAASVDLRAVPVVSRASIQSSPNQADTVTRMPHAQELYGNTKSASELIDYQAEGIVSKILLKTPSGSVTAFAFDAGQELSEHTTPFDALVSVIDGEVDIRISGTTHRVSGGELIILPANEPHALSAVSRFKMILTMLKA